jgi:hypothetical protein
MFHPVPPVPVNAETESVIESDVTSLINPIICELAEYVTKTVFPSINISIVSVRNRLNETVVSLMSSYSPVGKIGGGSVIVEVVDKAYEGSQMEPVGGAGHA